MLSTGVETDLPALAGVVDRRFFLPELAAGQRVLHLGCVDEGLTMQRSGTGALLHEQLAQVARDLVGVDISREGLELLESLVPGRYVHGDIETLGSLQLPPCDLVIVAEVIEHLKNPHRFYCELASYLRGSGATAVLTTPNAHGWVNQLRFAATRKELVHEDHLLVYTPTTLARSLTTANLKPTAWWVHSWARGGSAGSRVRSLVDTAVLRWNPWLGPGLIVQVRS